MKPQFPLIVAHRGARREKPENTLAAFDRALQLGADGLELDVQSSLEGEPVVWHDATLARAGLPRRRCADLPARELTHLSWGAAPGAPARHRLPLLEQVLEKFIRRTRLMIELKSPATGAEPERGIRRIAELLRGHRPEAWLLSFDATLLEQARRRMPGVPRVLNAVELNAATIRQARRCGASAVCVDARRLSLRAAASLHKNKLALWSYACETAPLVKRAVGAGSTVLIGDRPQWLRNAAIAGKQPDA